MFEVHDRRHEMRIEKRRAAIRAGRGRQIAVLAVIQLGTFEKIFRGQRLVRGRDVLRPRGWHFRRGGRFGCAQREHLGGRALGGADRLKVERQLALTFRLERPENRGQ